LKNAEDQLMKLKGVKEELEQTNKKCWLEVTKLQADLDTVMAGKTESDRSLESSKAEIRQLQQDLQAAVGNQESVSLSLADRSAEVQRLIDELKKLNTEKTAAEQLGSACQADNEKLKTELKQVVSYL